MILIMNDNYVKTCTPWLVFAHTAGVQQVFYYFNLSHTEVTDQILEAELRLFKLRPAPEVRRALRRRRARHLADVSAKSDSPRPHSAMAGCPLQGRFQKKIFRRGHWNEAPISRHRRRLWGLRRGCFPSQPTRGSGGASWAPSAWSRAEPRPQTPVQHFLRVTERFRWKKMLNMVIILTNTAIAEICWNSVENFVGGWAFFTWGWSRKYP